MLYRRIFFATYTYIGDTLIVCVYVWNSVYIKFANICMCSWMCVYYCPRFLRAISLKKLGRITLSIFSIYLYKRTNPTRFGCSWHCHFFCSNYEQFHYEDGWKLYAYIREQLSTHSWPPAVAQKTISIQCKCSCGRPALNSK